MTQAQHIISIFGGAVHLARALGHKHSSTVQGWKSRGVIPASQQQIVLELGRDLGVDISPEDFFDLPPQDEGAA